MAASDKMIIFLALLVLVTSNTYDTGKYDPKKYNILDDGKYYRPLTEGKYKPGDEGRYTYVYKQGLYPTDDGDYRYIHQDGQDGRFRESAEIPIRGDESNKIEYIGYKTYAGRYPYIHKVIKALEDEYVSTDSIFGKTFGSSEIHNTNVHGENEVALKCKPLKPGGKQSEFVTQYPPRSHIEHGENVGSFYTFKGTKTISTLSTPLFTTKLKLEYEVFIRVLDEITEVRDEDYLQEEKNNLRPHQKETKQKNKYSKGSSVPVPLQEIFDKIILQNEKPKPLNNTTKQKVTEKNQENIIFQKKIAIDDPKKEFVPLRSTFRVIKSGGAVDTKEQFFEVNNNSSPENTKHDEIDDKISHVVMNVTGIYQPSKEIEVPFELDIKKIKATSKSSPNISKNVTLPSTTEMSIGEGNTFKQLDVDIPINNYEDFARANLTEEISHARELITEQPTTDETEPYEDSRTTLGSDYDIEQVESTTHPD